MQQSLLFLSCIPSSHSSHLGIEVRAMEHIHNLSNESFSYSWLINIKPAFDLTGDDHHHRHSFDTRDGKALDFSSNCWMTESADFDFSVPSSESLELVHADEIFSNGIILPLHLIASPSEEDTKSSYPVLNRSLSLDSTKSLLSRSDRYCPHYMYSIMSGDISSSSSSETSCSTKRITLRRSKIKMGLKSPKKILMKYFCFLTPLYKRVKELGLNLNSTKLVRSGGGSIRDSPRTGNGFSSIEWCRNNKMFDMGSESRIYDAVLHCKKSIGQDE